MGMSEKGGDASYKNAKNWRQKEKKAQKDHAIWAMPCDSLWTIFFVWF